MSSITIITPSYNRAHLLPCTIDSILSQDFQDFEYLIIDDGSKDNTREVVKTYLKDPRVQYFYHDNKGESATVNRGWQMAKSPLVVIVNSDDPVKEGFLRILVDFMNQNKDVIVGYPDWDVIDENGKILRSVQVREYDVTEMIVSHHCYPGPGAVIRKSALPNINSLRDARFVFISDLVTWWNLSFYGRFARIPYRIATWRNHTGTLTYNMSLAIVDQHKLLMKEFFARKDIPISILKRKKEAFKNKDRVILHIINNYTKNNTSIKQKWGALKKLFGTGNFSKIHLKVFVRAIFGNSFYNLVIRKMFKKAGC